jgi:hypothetical protein
VVDRRFQLWAGVAACATVAAVVLDHGLGWRGLVVWVGLTAAAVVLFEVCYALARMCVPGDDWITQLNLAQLLGASVICASVLVLGLVGQSSYEIALGAVGALFFGAWSYWIFRRTRA